VQDAQRWWLESLIVAGHRIAAEDFARAVLDHPVRRPLAETLVWGEFAGAKLFRMFRVAGGRMLRLDGGGAYELQQLGAAGHGLGLVHPAELSPADLGSARAAFAGVTQALPQLDRPVLRLTEHERGKDTLTRFGGRIGFHALEAALTRRGWSVDEQGVGGGIAAFGKELARDRVFAVAVLRGTNGLFEKVVFRPHGTAIGTRRPDRLHEVTISEVLWDLEIAFGRLAPPPDAPAPAPPTQRGPRPAPSPAPPFGPAPIVERAKSGRSRCVVCGAAIAKDSLRIGVVRAIDTPAFTGNATAWLHPSCRDGAPELAGVTGLDDLLR
jgi:hypothetical protein